MKCVHAAVAAAILPGVALSQGERNNNSRGLRSQAIIEQFEKIRDQRAPAQNSSGKKETPRPAALFTAGDPLLGMNLWHLRLAEPAAPVIIRGLKHKKDDPSGNKDWTPERFTLTQPIPEGEHLRLSFESANAGYLYVIDRDVFADGAKGPPTLIFPTARLRGGNNLLGPGAPIEIPELQDKPPAFTVERTRPNQVAIALILILAPRILPEIRIQQDEQKLPEDIVSRWEKQWGTRVTTSEDHSMAGKLYTLAEKIAVADPARPLDGKDPVPLTLFHRQGHPGEGMFATALIKLAPASTTQ
jgi:hypothetical protein